MINVVKVMKTFLSFSLSIFIIGFFQISSNDLACSFAKTNLQNTEETRALTEEEAISLAEDFIVKNGYTEVAALERKKLTPELFDKLVSFELVMKLRHNSLQPKAYGVIRKRRNALGWTIIFTRTPNSQFDPKNGRGVSMTIDGKNIFMEPRDFLLATVDKKLQSENK